MDDSKVEVLLARYTAEQLARAYIKASRARNKAERELKALRTKATLDKFCRAAGF